MRSGRENSQPQIFHKGIEIAIAVEQLVSPHQAKSGDERVNRFPDGYTPLSQKSMVLRGGYCNLATRHRPKLKRGEKRFRGTKILFETKALQHLHHYEVADQNVRSRNMIQ